MSLTSRHDPQSLDAGSLPVAEVPGFDAEEFASRWRAARLAACRAVTGEAREDADALVAVADEQREPLLRAIFDNGRRLGASAVRHFRAEWDLDDVAALLPRLGAPCFAYPCESSRGARVMQRQGCNEWREGAGFVCDYWREALDGLVMGVAHDTFLSRHSSRGNGGPDCVDVLYVERETRSLEPRAESMKLAPLDAEIVRTLDAEVRRTLSVKLSLAVDGVADGVVHYRLGGSAEDLSSGAAARLRQTIDAKLARLATPLRALDVSPRPVLVGEP